MKFQAFPSDDIKSYTQHKGKPQHKGIQLRWVMTLALSGVVIGAIVIGSIVLHYKADIVNEMNRAIQAQMIAAENLEVVMNKSIEATNKDVLQMKNESIQKEYEKGVLIESINRNDLRKGEVETLGKAIEEKNSAIQIQKETRKNNDKKIATLREEIYIKNKEKAQQEIKLASLQSDRDRKKMIEHPKYHSVLITNDEQYVLLMKWINLGKNFDMELLYRGSECDFAWDRFHESCDSSHIHNTLVVIQLENGSLIGGFTYNNWSGFGYKKDDKAFVFNMSKKKMYAIQHSTEAIYTSSRWGPIFGRGDIALYYHNFLSIGSFKTYGGADLDITDGVNRAKVTEVEVLTFL